MCVKVFGRMVNAQAEPIHNGYFVRCAVTDVFGIQVGSVLEVNGSRCQVKYLIAGSPGEPEVWAILSPVASLVAAHPPRSMSAGRQ